MTDSVVTPMRSVIVGTLVVCLAVAVAPWLTGGQEPVAMFISAAVLLLAALLAWRQPDVRKLNLGPLVITFALLIGFALLSLIWSVDRYSTVLWVTEWVMAGLAFRLAYVIAGEPKGRRWMLNAYLASAAVFSIVAIWIYLTSPYDRLTGTFWWPNPAAAYLIPAIVMGLDRLRVSAARMKYLWFATTTVFLASFLLTDSRAATIVLVFLIVVYCLVTVTKRQFWISFVCTLILGVGLSTGLVALGNITTQHSAKITPGSRLAEIADGQSESLADRVYYVESAIEIWLAHPLGGTGAGTYGNVHPQYQKRVISASSDAHNLYVQTLAELGVVGAVSLILLIVWLYSGVLRGLADSPELMPVALGAAGLLLHFGLDIDASYPALLMLAAVLLGLVFRQWHQGRIRISWRVPAVAALLLLPTVSLYQSDAWASRAQVSESNGDYPDAAGDYATAHSGLVFNPTYINAEGIAYYTVASGGGSQSKAAAALAMDKALLAERLDPDDGQNYQLEGRVLALEGKLPQAETALKTALKLDPFDHPEYALDLATVQLLNQNPSAALKTANSMLALYPDSVIDNRNADSTLRPALGNLAALAGNIYLADGNLRQADEAARLSLHDDPTSLRGQALAHQLALRGYGT